MNVEGLWDAPPVKLVVGAVTDVGRSRDHNEDSYLVWNLRANEAPQGLESTGAFTDRDGIIMAVCDGMGGAAAGERASAIAVDTLASRSARLDQDLLGRPDEFGDWLCGSVTEADRRILDEAATDPELEGMGSTMTVISVTPGGLLFLAHVGDSRAYHLRDGQLRQLSVDHSFVAELVAMGKISAEEARTHQNRNLLMQALGLGRPLDVDRLTIELLAGDRMMLCSDGLYDLVSDEEIRQAMSSTEDPATLCHDLIALANERGGSDNITVIAARVDE